MQFCMSCMVSDDDLMMRQRRTHCQGRAVWKTCAQSAHCGSAISPYTGCTTQKYEYVVQEQLCSDTRCSSSNMYPGPTGACLLFIAAWALPLLPAVAVAHVLHMPSSAAQPQYALHCSCSPHSQLQCCSAERQGAVKSLDYALAAGSSAAEQAKAEVETTLRRTSEQVCIPAECALAFCIIRYAPSRLHEADVCATERNSRQLVWVHVQQQALDLFLQGVCDFQKVLILLRTCSRQARSYGKGKSSS